MEMVFKKGTLIAKSKPFAYVICNSEIEKRCGACLQLNEDLHKCTQCGVAKYCNKKCQMQGWILHKLECKHLKKVYPKVTPEIPRLMALIILKLKLKNGHLEEEKILNVTRNYNCLVNHVEDLQKDKKRCDHFVSLCHVLEEYLGKDLLPTASELLSHFGKITVNCFSITDGEMQAVGVGMYLGASGFDHSCQPNASAVFYGADMHVRALKDIAHSDITKINLSYIDIFYTTSDRREQLREQYYFTCNCTLCNDHVRDASLNYVRCGNVSCTQPIDLSTGRKSCTCGHKIDAAAIEEVVTASDEFLQTIKMVKKSNKEKYELILEKCKVILRDCSAHLHPLNFRLVKIWDLATDACIELEMWESALEYSTNTLPAYRLYYGNKNPILGIQLLKHGKLQVYLQYTSEATKILAEASNVLQLTHGERHPIYLVLQQLVDKCQ